MKNLRLSSLLSLLLLLFFSSCKDEDRIETTAEKDFGQVSFNISDDKTKTIYDEENNLRINWKYGDVVKISCAQSTPTEGAYTVEKSSDPTKGTLKGDPTTSLKWNKGAGKHTFYGAYPYDRVIISENKIKCQYNTNQMLSKIKNNNYAPINMEDGFMVAKTVSAPQSRISLAFKPVFTTLDIKIPGGTTSAAVTITSLSVTLNNGSKYISKTGEFTIDGSTLQNNIPLQPYADADVNEKETITAKIGSVSVNPGDTAVFTLFLPPVNIDANTAVITAVIDGKTCTASIKEGIKGGTRRTVKMGGQLEKYPQELTIIPSTLYIPKGKDSTFIAVLKYSDESVDTLKTGLVWSSNAATVATVNQSTGLVKALERGSVIIKASYTEGTKTFEGTSNVTVTNYITAFTITPSPATVYVGETLQLIATVTLQDGTQLDVTKEADWKYDYFTLNPFYDRPPASVNETGEVTGKSEGTMTIYADYGGIESDICSVNVISGSFKVTPNIVELVVGQVQKLTAIAVHEDGTEETLDSGVRWESMDTGIASVSQTGEVTGVKAGSTTITASCGGKSATATVNVVGIDKITIGPNPLNIAMGKTGTLSVTEIKMSDGRTLTPIPDSGFKWEIVDAGVVTGTSTGNSIILTGKKAGSTTVTVTYGGKAAAAKVNVINLVDKITIEPNPLNIYLVGKTGTLSVTKITMSDGSTLELDQIPTSGFTWKIANTGVVTEKNAPSTGNSIILTGNTVGSTTVTVTYGGKSATATVNVEASVKEIIIEPNPLTIDMTKSGKGTLIAKKIRLSNGSLLDQIPPSMLSSFKWEIANTEVVTGTSIGRGIPLTGIKAGTTTVSVTFGGYTATVTVKVVDVAQIVLKTYVMKLKLGEQNALYIEQIRKSDETTLDPIPDSGFTWTITDRSVVTGSSTTNGILLTGTPRGGSTRVTVTYRGKSSSARVDVYDNVHTLYSYYQWDADTYVSGSNPAYNTTKGHFNVTEQDDAYQICQNCPKLDELKMYLAAGVYWVDDAPARMFPDGIISSNGLMLKKKENIPGFEDNTAPGISKTVPKLGRTYESLLDEGYFFLPAGGCVDEMIMNLHNIGESGYYWTRTCRYNTNRAFSLVFNKDYAGVGGQGTGGIFNNSGDSYRGMGFMLMPRK